MNFYKLAFTAAAVPALFLGVNAAIPAGYLGIVSESRFLLTR
jgi:hypothetical protein